MRGFRRIAAVLVMALLCSAAAGPEDMTPVPDAVPNRIVITAGTAGGVYYAWATALAAQLEQTHPALTVQVLTSSGSIENLARLAAGTADLAVSANDAAESRNGEQSSDGSGDTVRLRALARIYDDYYHVIVRSSTDVTSFRQLAGKKIAIGDPGSGTALIAGRLLALAGISVQEAQLGVVDGLAALRKGTVDAVFWSGGVPTSAVEQAAEQTPLRLLALDNLAARMRSTYGAVYRAAAIPPGRYGSAEQVDTVALANLLVARADTDSDLVTAVLETIFDRRSEIVEAAPAANQIDRRSAILTGGLELHPAAAAYYRREKL